MHGIPTAHRARFIFMDQWKQFNITMSVFPETMNHSMAHYVLILLTLLFSLRIVRWLARIHKVRKTMPVVPSLFPSRSKYRMLIPKRWQTYHRDWHMEYGRDLYKSHNSDVFALINLFEYDNVFVSDPEGVLEMKVTGSDRYQIDLYQASQVHSFTCLMCVNCEIAIYGPNIVSSAGSEWKFHRKIAVRAFPQRTIELVHSETTRQVLQMMSSWEKTIKNNTVIVEK